MIKNYKKLADVSYGASRCEFQYPQSDGSTRVEWVDPKEVFGMLTAMVKISHAHFGNGKLTESAKIALQALRNAGAIGVTTSTQPNPYLEPGEPENG